MNLIRKTIAVVAVAVLVCSVSASEISRKKVDEITKNPRFKGTISDGDHVVVDVEEGKLSFLTPASSQPKYPAL